MVIPLHSNQLVNFYFTEKKTAHGYTNKYLQLTLSALITLYMMCNCFEH